MAKKLEFGFLLTAALLGVASLIPHGRIVLFSVVGLLIAIVVLFWAITLALGFMSLRPESPRYDGQGLESSPQPRANPRRTIREQLTELEAWEAERNKPHIPDWFDALEEQSRLASTEADKEWARTH